MDSVDDAQAGLKRISTPVKNTILFVGMGSGAQAGLKSGGIETFSI